MATFEFNNTDDIIDARDLIERFEELEQEKDDYEQEQKGTMSHDWSKFNPDDSKEFSAIGKLLSELCGNGGDEQWRGDWYPITLIRDSYFEQYMDDMLEDCGEIPKDLPCYLSITVDYKALQMDYSSVEIDGVTYWYR